MNIIRILKWKASGYNRNRKIKQIEAHISEQDVIIDVGVSPITQPPINYICDYFLQKKRPIDALGLESLDFTAFIDKYFNCRLQLFDGRDFSVIAKRYDIALCNAVIEHVGTREEQLSWLIGLRSICDKLIITTPNRFFPVESHTNTLFKHIFSRKFKEYLFKYHGVNLFSKSELLDMLKKAGYNVVKTKRNKLFFLTLDFLIICE